MMASFSVLSLLCTANTPIVAADHEVKVLSEAQRAALLADYPNTAWNQHNWTPLQTHLIGGGLYTFADDIGTRTFFLVTSEGVIVGDPLSTQAAEKLMAAIRAVTDKPIEYVIYSHNHWDHAKGGQIFKDAGATFVAHDKCRQRMIERPHPEVVVPDITFGGNHLLELGGERVELLYLGRNHSSCMVFPVFSEGRYVFLVDLVSPGAVPWSIVPDTDFIGTILSLEYLERLNFELMIPGHGVPIAPKSALVERRLYLTALMNAVEVQLAAGYDPASFMTNVKTEMQPWAYMRGFDVFIEDNIKAMLHFVALGE